MTGGDVHTDSDLTLFCLKCDYNLTGIVSDRCPECGEAIDWDNIRSQMEYARAAYSNSKALLLLSVPAISIAVRILLTSTAPKAIGLLVGGLLYLSIPYAPVMSCYLSWKLQVCRNSQMGINPYTKIGAVRFIFGALLMLLAQFALVLVALVVVVPLTS